MPILSRALTSGSVSAGGSADVRVYGEPLSGTKNGSNLVFTASVAFVATGTRKMKVYWNGVLLEEGAGCDYVASESGGVGTGFDTITMATGAVPLAGENLVIDYDPDV